MRPSLEQRIETTHKQDIDLAPLLDVVFILLIFFIVTTVFVRETGVEVDKPTAVSTQSLEKSVILLAITHDQRVVYDGVDIGLNGVKSTVVQLIRKQQRPVVIQADKRVPTELLIKVLDGVKLAGVESVSVATKPGT